MTDPYEILGVSRNASDDDIKKAYRDLARKYHPDNYANNPLADLAQEKMKQINQAYDEITRERTGGGYSDYNTGNSSSSGNYSNTQNNTGSARADYAQIRRLIMAGQLDKADNMLNSIQTHDAEWHFLKGSIYFARGWYDEARRYYQTAHNMNPSNPEYTSALYRMGNMNGMYRSYGGGSGLCDFCMALMCADCLCDSMRGMFCC